MYKYGLVRYTARHGPFDGPVGALRRDDLAVDDAVAEVRARRHGRLARGAAGTREADVPERRKFGDLHKLDEEYGAGCSRRDRTVGGVARGDGGRISSGASRPSSSVAWLGSGRMRAFTKNDLSIPICPLERNKWAPTHTQRTH